MHLSPSFRLMVRWLILISCGFWVLCFAFGTKAAADSPILEPISADEFQRIFGLEKEGSLLANQIGVSAAAAARARQEQRVPFRDKSIDFLPEIRPRAPLKQRDVLPETFANLVKPALPAPELILAGYEGQPTISERGCAVREHDQHNLAYRCNAPIALNIPGGNTPSKRFLKEMETETGFDVGKDVWPGDKDAVTGDRLLTARDIVVGMRFTLRYLDQRGFTIAKASCAKRKKWRWSYVCLQDDRWAALSEREKCEFILDGLLTVEGGKITKWSFAPMPSPDSPDGTLISFGLTGDPLGFNDKESLCTEVRAQERVDRMVQKLLAQAPEDLGASIQSLADTETAHFALAAQIKGREMIVARLGLPDQDAGTRFQAELEQIWREIGGSQVCLEHDCARKIQVALPPLPDYRPESIPEREN